MKKWHLKLRLVLWSILSLAVFSFVFLAIVPSGHIVYVNNFSKNFFASQTFIEKFTPPERVENGNGFIKISGDPVYFSFFSPRKFEQARVTVKYQNLNEERNPVLELGLLMDKTVWNYKLEPLENKTLENLAATWTKISSHGLTFLQREKKFNSLDDFLKSDPQRNDLALYNYDLKTKFTIAGYQADSKWRSYPTLRGAYQFYVYIKDEDFNLKLSLARAENLSVADEAILVLSDAAGKEVFKKDISADMKIDLNLPQLPEGAYKVELRTGDNILTTALASTQSKLIFVNRVWPMTPTEIFSDNKNIKVRTVTPASLGEIEFGAQKFTLNKTYEPFDFTLSADQNLNRIKTAFPDLIIENNGLFVFSPEQYFNPDFKRFSVGLDLSKINYILADYQAPAVIVGDKVATVDFTLSNAYREFGKNSFMLSLPGATASDTAIIIKEVKIELWGKTLWEKIKAKL